MRGSSGRALILFYAAQGSQLQCWSWPRTPSCRCDWRGLQRVSCQNWNCSYILHFATELFVWKFTLTFSFKSTIQWLSMMGASSSISCTIPIFCHPCSLASWTLLPSSPSAVAYLLAIPLPPVPLLSLVMVFWTRTPRYRWPHFLAAFRSEIGGCTCVL